MKRILTIISALLFSSSLIFAQEADMKVGELVNTGGDEILAIDGVPTIGLESSECSERMKGKPGSKVVFTVRKLRTGDTLDIPVIRERIHFPDVEYAGMLDDSTGYILQTGFTENVSGELRSHFLDL